MERFEKEEDEHLVKEVEKYRSLFDPNDEDYKNLASKDAIWGDIAKEMKKEVSDCKKRWRSIRDAYLKQKKNKNLSSARSRKRPWPLMQFLTFLDTVEPENIAPISSVKELGDGPNKMFEFLRESSSKPSNTAATIEPYIPPRRKRILNLKLSDGEGARNAMQKFHSEMKTKDLMGEGDAIEVFFKSMALTVKKLPSNLQAEAKMKTLTLITNLELRAK